MGDSYYPEYYLRKRRKDRVYALVTRLVAVLVIVGGLGCAAGFLTWQYVLKPRKAGSGITQQMADKRQELATQQKLADAQRQPAADPAVLQTVDYQPTQLSALSYAESMPFASVGLLSSGGTAAGGAADASQAAPPVPDTTPPPASPPPAEATPVELAPAARPEPEVAKQQDKPQDTQTKEAAAKPEPKKEEKKEEKPQQAPPTPPPAPPAAAEQVFRIYAGSASSKEEADNMSQRLSSLGLSGSVVRNGGDYLVLVASVPEFSQAEALTSDLRGKGFAAFSTRGKAR